jgi:hypothetical protein
MNCMTHVSHDNSVLEKGIDTGLKKRISFAVYIFNN